MAQSTPTFDRQVTQGTAASGGGTFVTNYAIPTDKLAHLRAHAILTAASAGHQSAGGHVIAEYVIQNLNGAMGAPAALSGSANPSNSGTASFDGSGAQAADAAFTAAGGPTIAWTNSGTNAVATVTNPGGTSANVTVVIDAIIVGST